VGRVFETETVLENLSAGGFFVRLMRRVNPGTRVFVLIQFSIHQVDELTTSRLAANGFVCRAEPQSDGGWGLGVELTRYRFL